MNGDADYPVVRLDSVRLGNLSLHAMDAAYSTGLDVPGADADGVHVLRTVDDAAALLSALTERSRLAIVGPRTVSTGSAGTGVAHAASRPAEAVASRKLRRESGAWRSGKCVLTSNGSGSESNPNRQGFKFSRLTRVYAPGRSR